MIEKQCWLCGRNGACDPLDRHHVFPGMNRKNSEKYDAVVYLCHNSCHIFGNNAVHRNRENRDKLMDYMQRKLMRENSWTVQDFINIFGKNFLMEE